MAILKRTSVTLPRSPNDVVVHSARGSSNPRGEIVGNTPVLGKRVIIDSSSIPPKYRRRIMKGEEVTLLVNVQRIEQGSGVLRIFANPRKTKAIGPLSALFRDTPYKVNQGPEADKK